MLAKLGIAGFKDDYSRAVKAAEQVSHYPWLKILTPTIVFLVLLVVTKISVDTLNDPTVFPVKEVKVESDFHYLKRQSVIDVVSREVRYGFFGVDLNGLNAQLEKLPWVQAAAVRRVWPDTLVVEVVERTAFAYWGNQGLVSEDGKAFFPDMNDVPSGLPTLSGPKASAQEMTVFYREVSNIFSPYRLQVEKLFLNDRRAWELVLNNGLVIKLGRVKGVERIHRLMRVYGEVVGDKVSDINYVDLRYPNGFAVQWKSGSDITAKKTKL